MAIFNLALVGFGSVGRAFAALLLHKRAQLSAQYDIEARVTAITTANHGQIIAAGGLNLEDVLARSEAGGGLNPEAGDESINLTTLLERSQAHVLFEITPVNYETGRPASDHIRTALQMGVHAVTANKGPVVHAYRELSALAAEQGVSFGYEATVMDGAPVFSLWRETLVGARLQSFRGILNSTTNYMLTRMESGASYQEAVEQAQALGIAETDPRGDTQGWDAAIKVAALATVLMQVPLLPAQVDREGIEAITRADIDAARQAGKRWKLICQAERTGGGVHARVQPVELDTSDPLYFVNGTSSALTLRTDVLGDLTLTETDPGPHTTAFGLLADFINAVRVR